MASCGHCRDESDGTRCQPRQAGGQQHLPEDLLTPPPAEHVGLPSGLGKDGAEHSYRKCKREQAEFFRPEDSRAGYEDDDLGDLAESACARDCYPPRQKRGGTMPQGFATVHAASVPALAGRRNGGNSWPSSFSRLSVTATTPSSSQHPDTANSSSPSVTLQAGHWESLLRHECREQVRSGGRLIPSASGAVKKRCPARLPAPFPSELPRCERAVCPYTHGLHYSGRGSRTMQSQGISACGATQLLGRGGGRLGRARHQQATSDAQEV